MEKQSQTDIRKKNTIVALEKNLGIVTKTCKAVDIHRSTFYEWYNEDTEFAKQVDSVGDIALDFVESALHKQIEEGIPSSTIFYLKTKGKKRGYIESLELTGDENKPLKTTIEWGGQQIEI